MPFELSIKKLRMNSQSKPSMSMFDTFLSFIGFSVAGSSVAGLIFGLASIIYSGNLQHLEQIILVVPWAIGFGFIPALLCFISYQVYAHLYQFRTPFKDVIFGSVFGYISTLIFSWTAEFFTSRPADFDTVPMYLAGFAFALNGLIAGAIGGWLTPLKKAQQLTVN